MVKAKFIVNKIERTLSSKAAVEDGKKVYAPVELQTIMMAPVYAKDDPQCENSRFWAATPTGLLQLGMLDSEAAAYFELGKEYCIDFIKAKAEGEI